MVAQVVVVVVVDDVTAVLCETSQAWYARSELILKIQFLVVGIFREAIENIYKELISSIEKGRERECTSSLTTGVFASLSSNPSHRKEKRQKVKGNCWMVEMVGYL